MYIYNKVLVTLLLMLGIATGVQAQDKIINPDISYAGTERDVVVGGIAVSGVEGYEDYVLTGISGLAVGQRITVPGSDITDAVKRYWKHGLFSKVAIAADSIVGDKIYLHIYLAVRPRVSTINYIGLKKSEREDMDNKLGLLKGMQVTPNALDRAKILAKKYFDDKGYKNADIEIVQRDDVANKNQVILDIMVDKKEKIKVHKITIDGNEKISDKKLKGNFFSKGAFAKIHEAGKLANIFKSKKYTPERWKDDKNNLISKYNEYGYFDASILSDSVTNYDSKHVDVYVKVHEGKQYFLRNITWVGNTVYTTDHLNAILGMKRGDVYNMKLMNKRLVTDDDAAANLYYNNGYVFSRIEPVEVNIDGDSIDVEMRVTEGPQAYLSHVRINGNDRLYENVVRRELHTKPGDLFSREALMRTARELGSMGHFDAEHVAPDVKPNPEDGTVDVNWNLVQKSNDQIEFSLGWGQTGVIGRVGLKLNNFSMRNLFRKNSERRGVLPVGDGEVLSLGVQANTYYQSYNVSYSTNWFGGKRPVQFSVGAYWSKYSDVSSNYYNTALMRRYYDYTYGYGSNYYNNYESYVDPDKYMKLLGLSLGWGKRLRWPDDYFTLSLQLAYQRYTMKNWGYFLMSNGSANNLNLTLSLNRTSTDNPLFPRRGSEFSASVTVTPPWSSWDKKDYANLANNQYSPTYNAEQQEKYRWVEYHKWKFKSKTYTALSGGSKCFVLMTRVELGLLGSYNKYKKSPFETFYMGGDGMSGYSSNYATETIGLRGYENGALTPSASSQGYAYDRFSLELRYPFLLGNTTIYGLGFLEAGNAWQEASKFNPFDMKRSAGLGVRIFLPMVGLMGIDWAYGFDKVFGTKGGSQFHFILGQEF
ncbi:Outer membrane protein omp85 precursor [Segatella buccae]|jgi:outer membrane protein insertion porin family|uniref:Outer membrane protein omp85 n=1 Tax=Segatella buccae TaxID=28126 RepID=A0AAQ1UIU2_9BACT|nr:POTRA domain-containing protein [Segatella buccae]EFC74681.1 outer membrane protein, OMP85 family [Segatella buccae D17]EJP33513.1 putative outer membrane protein assembly complex, YaeT protein [Prevotella sp. MSX73]MBS5895821.1 outer membrane protein assembly factor [Segatella buccae]SUB80167.1 Outer membrane protein omp85 precursor [Segatella buccae]